LTLCVGLVKNQKRKRIDLRSGPECHMEKLSANKQKSRVIE